VCAAATRGRVPVRRCAAVREGAVRRAGRRRRPSQRHRHHRVHQGPHLRQRHGVSAAIIHLPPAAEWLVPLCQLINCRRQSARVEISDSVQN